jgi:hypothetical protein
MCTAIVCIDPDSPVPVLLAGVRDEFAARPWAPPGRHWTAWPQLLGGRDLEAGGTWLAVDPQAPRAACVLNGFGRPAPQEARLTRGDVPLRLAAEGELDGLDLPRYDPFHLIGAEPGRVRVWSWDGFDLDEHVLPPGLHIVVNSGLEGEGEEAYAPPGAMADMAARLSYFRPRLRAAARPRPIDGDVATAWGEWLPLLAGDGLDPLDQRALLVRRDFGEGRIWGSSSISLVALHPAGARYDFSAVPSIAWSRVV